MTVTTPALLFPAISLLFLAYNGRFLTLANLIRQLHAEFQRSGGTATLAQIENLRRRMTLIRWMELAAVAAFVLAAVAMMLLHLEFAGAGSLVFGAALASLITSLVLAAAEIHISVDALRILLGEIGRS